jgi:carbamoylphosphate synthase large subunit
MFMVVIEVNARVSRVAIASSMKFSNFSMESAYSSTSGSCSRLDDEEQNDK